MTPRAWGAALLAGAPAPAAVPPDYGLPDGHFYTQAAGQAAPNGAGFAVTDDGGIPLWSELQRYGGTPVLGYPISGRFLNGPFVAQAFQKGILQWRPEQRQAELANVMDLLHAAGKDAALEAASGVPPQAANDAEAGMSAGDVRHARLKLLDFPNSGFIDAYNGVSDPLAVFGLPTSSITDEGAAYVIRLQRTAFQLWKTDQPWAPANAVTVVNAGELARDYGLVPGSALRPEPARMISGAAGVVPWSGWWWPSLDGGQGPHLFDAGGPLDKYDRYVQTLNRPDPRTQQWELAHFRYRDPRLNWAGKCNGWAVAALVEPEPTHAITAHGVTFDVGDLKALLSDYHFADPALWLYGGQDAGGVQPADFHRQVLSWIGRQHKGLVLNAYNGASQVDSFPAYAFQALYQPDPADPARTHVTMTLWLADYHVSPNFVGTRTWPNGQLKTYHYVIHGSRDNPSGGEWEEDSQAGPYAHPQDIWFPDVNPASRNAFGELTSPALERTVIDAILGGG